MDTRASSAICCCSWDPFDQVAFGGPADDEEFKRRGQLLCVRHEIRNLKRLFHLQGNPLTTIEPPLVEGEDGLGLELRVEWEKHYKAEGIRNFSSE